MILNDRAVQRTVSRKPRNGDQPLSARSAPESAGLARALDIEHPRAARHRKDIDPPVVTVSEGHYKRWDSRWISIRRLALLAIKPLRFQRWLSKIGTSEHAIVPRCTPVHSWLLR